VYEKVAVENNYDTLMTRLKTLRQTTQNSLVSLSSKDHNSQP